MAICACGCEEEIEPQPHHQYKPSRFKPNHFAKAGLTQKGKRTSSKRIPVNTYCACGCGQIVPEFFAGGAPRYVKSPGNKFYVSRGHRARCPSKPRAKQFRRINSAGYVMLYKPDHHLAEKDGYVREHRLVWEEANGRRLEPNEDVHHINEDHADNRPENLVALSKSKHLSGHKKNPDDKHRSTLRIAGKKGAESRWHKTP